MAIFSWFLGVFFVAAAALAFALPLLLDLAARRQWDRVCATAEAERNLPIYDEAVLLGPVSAWVAEGEARAVREWEQKRGHRATTEHVHDLLNRPEPPCRHIRNQNGGDSMTKRRDADCPLDLCDGTGWVDVTDWPDSSQTPCPYHNGGAR